MLWPVEEQIVKKSLLHYSKNLCVASQYKMWYIVYMDYLQYITVVHPFEYQQNDKWFTIASSYSNCTFRKEGILFIMKNKQVTQIKLPQSTTSKSTRDHYNKKLITPVSSI